MAAVQLTPSLVIIHTDGGSRGNPGRAACAFVVEQANHLLHEEAHVLGMMTNNEAEYNGFLRSLQWLHSVTGGTEVFTQPVEGIVWQLDSMLVVEQLNRRWKIKDARMQDFAKNAWQSLQQLSIPYSIEYVPRAENARADGLLNRALDSQSLNSTMA